MINTENSIPCPVCGTKIPFNVQALLTGVNFSCPNIGCNSSIGLSAESAPIVEETVEKLEILKKSSKQKT